MKTSERGVALIKAHEGLRLQAYQDPVGVWTIGYGHTNTKALATVADDPRVVQNLGAIDAPVLAQTPNDPAQRERQLAEFEKIKAGF